MSRATSWSTRSSGGLDLQHLAAPEDQIVEISFEKVGVKKTMANFAPLVKITTEE